MPDTPIIPPAETDAAERAALEAAVARAWASVAAGGVTPHEAVRNDLHAFIEAARRRIAALDKGA